MYGNNPSDADLRNVMQTLRSAGVATVRMEFSGGNDEGGVDGVEYLDAEGNKVDLPTSNAYKTEKWNPETRTYGPATWQVYCRHADGSSGHRPATAEEVKWAEVGAALEYPVYDRWGSFAGEFHVYGTLTWDVATGKHTLSGQESHEVWEDF
jgi:hypothetical protein